MDCNIFVVHSVKSINWAFRFLLILIGLVSRDQLIANHFLGGEIRYKAMNTSNNIYQIELVLDRYCSSSPLPFDQSLTILTPDGSKYQKTTLVASRVKTEFIPVGCSLGVSDCGTASSQVIERTSYALNLILDTGFRDRECLIYFVGNNRVLSQNLIDPDQNLLLYLSFIPLYNNSSFVLSEKSRHQLLNNQQNKICYNSFDEDLDSTIARISRPIVDISYNSSQSNLSFNPIKSLMQPGLSDNKPIYATEPIISIVQNEWIATPNITQNSWLSIQKEEYRKLKINGRDTSVCLSRSNMERLFISNSLNSQLNLSIVKSASLDVKINQQNVTICQKSNANTILYCFPIEKSITLVKHTLGFGQTPLSSAMTRILGTTVDTIAVSVTIPPSNIDYARDLTFQLEACHSASLTSFTRYFTSNVSVFNTEMFELDTILSCNTSVSIPLLTKKNAIYSLGTRTVSNPKDILKILNPKDTWVTGVWIVTNSNCPNTDSFYLNQGSLFNTQTTSYAPTCFGYNDGRARIIVSGSNTPFSFLWSNGMTTDSISGIGAGKYSVMISDKDNCKQTDSVLIMNPPGVRSSFQVDKPISCFDSANGRGHIAIIGAPRPYEYGWTHNLSTDSFLDSLRAGIYSGVFSYLNGAGTNCSQNFSYNIAQPDSIRVSAVVNDNPCFGGSRGKLALIASGGNGFFTYNLGSFSSTNNLFTGLASSSYPIIVSDIKGCRSKMTLVTIGSPPKIDYKLGTSLTICQNVNVGSIQITDLIGGVPPYRLKMLGNEYSGPFVSNDLPQGRYNIEISDANFCKADTYTTINMQYIFKAQIDSLVNSKCFGSNDGHIRVKVKEGTAPYIYTFNNHLLSSFHDTTSYAMLNPKSYAIRVEDKNNCFWDTTVLLTEPSKLAISDTLYSPTCNVSKDGRISLGINGGTLPYSLAFFDSSFRQIPGFDSLASGLYMVRILDRNLCSKDSTYRVPGVAPFTAKIAIASGIRCFGESNGKLTVSQVGGFEPFQYSWNGIVGPNQGKFIDKLSAGTHRIEVSDSKGCKASDIISLLQPRPLVIEAISSMMPSCPGAIDGTITVSASGGSISDSNFYLYSINGGLTTTKTNSFYPLTAGVYMVRVQDSNSCVVDSNFRLYSEKKLSTSLNPEYLIASGSADTLRSNLIYDFNTDFSDIKSISWQPTKGLSCVDCPNPVITPFVEDQYVLSIRYGRNCLIFDTTNVAVGSPKDIFIPNSFSPNEDQKNDEWYIYGPNITQLQLNVFSKRGHLVFQTNDQRKGWNGQFKGEDANVGVYTYVATIRFSNGLKKEYRGLVSLIR
jgi:gliding motility-associated-like protein